MVIKGRRTAPLLLFFFLSLLLQRPISAEKKSYVVYFGGHSQSPQRASLLSGEHLADTHYEFLGSILGSKEKAKDAIFYSYTNYINGFAATLEEEEVSEISKQPGVISVFPNKEYRLHTTRSWEFLGLEKDGRIHGGSIWKKARFGEDVIIGNLDTGVWPESMSFNDEGMGPIPSKWKGICEEGFKCNRKLIGARHFNKGYQAAGGITVDPAVDNARDYEGHGTHTLSTAAGRFVPNANIFGFGNGTAKGGSPNARVAAYKVCWPSSGDGGGCFNSDILAAFDAAIEDGVDVLSVSLGGDPGDYFEDGLAIGSFHAVKNGITVVCSAGNAGPSPGTVSNVAPWILTVGASTVDRTFQTFLALGNKKHIEGQSFSTSHLNRFAPMISSIDARAAYASVEMAQLCFENSLDPKKVKGKIVACLRGMSSRVEKGLVVREAGGVGMVLANDPMSGNVIVADAHVLPAIEISYSDGLAVFSYLKSTKSPYGLITNPKTKLGVKPAPVMAAFSSQGPNVVNPEILKPDITAPGVSIIAAFTGASSPTDLDSDQRRVAFNSESGTSMSCPHIAGIAGLLKSLHPDWSPAAIRSAIMTTATTQDNTRGAITDQSLAQASPFNYGSGHVQPNRAMDPGLVYDLTPTDYLNFLCSVGYNSSQIATFNDKPYSCPSKTLKIEHLNYPSISVPNLSGKFTIVRTVKNVGTPGMYTARVISPKGISVSVSPKSLEFEKVGEEKKFEVSLKAKKSARRAGSYVFGTLVWSDGKHFVRSPIAVKVTK